MLISYVVLHNIFIDWIRKLRYEICGYDQLLAESMRLINVRKSLQGLGRNLYFFPDTEQHLSGRLSILSTNSVLVYDSYCEDIITISSVRLSNHD